MQSAILREDAGRKYQATTDEYALPADDEEKDRLNHQHFAFKAQQHDSNYLAPFDEALKHVEGEEKRLLDLGCGTGLWAIEMARQFPHVEVRGVDIAPLQEDENVPDNVQFGFEDVTTGLGYPDNYFDAIHSRLMVAGIRDWPDYIKEIVRITRPGGLICFVEIAGDFGLNAPPKDPAALDKGFPLWASLVSKAMVVRNMHSDPGAMIPDLIKDVKELEKTKVVETKLPMTAWSDDPLLKKVGQLMLPDTRAISEAFRLLICDACNVTKDEYSKVVQDFLKDVENKDIQAVAPINHVWTWKVAA